VPQFKTVGLCVNTLKPNARRIRRELKIFLEKNKCRVLDDVRIPREKLISRSDLVIVLGGDGTLLNVVRHLTGKHHPPILGVNLGSLGFLTEITTEELQTSLGHVLRNQFQVSERNLLLATVMGSSKQYLALNEIVVNRGAFARILTCEVQVDGHRVARYQSDGVIIATATGSTAHSLSSGGPIVYPTLEAVIINPICPHTLSNRPIVLSWDRKIKLALVGKISEAGLTIDGQQGIKLKKNARVLVTKAPFKAQLISSPKRNYWELLHTKLNLNVRNEIPAHG
jgi:NAD+ kinase